MKPIRGIKKKVQQFAFSDNEQTQSLKSYFLSGKRGHQSTEGNKRRRDWWNISMFFFGVQNVNFLAAPKRDYSSLGRGWCDPSPSSHCSLPLLRNSISETPTGLRQRWMPGWIDREIRTQGLMIDCTLVRMRGLAWWIAVHLHLAIVPSHIPIHAFWEY